MASLPIGNRIWLLYRVATLANLE